MTRSKQLICLLAVLAVFGAIQLARSQDAAAKDVAAKKIYAQKLVDDTVAKHPELIVLAFHVTPPNGSDNVIIASNIGRIGKKADEDDMRVINTGKPNLEVNKTGDRFEVEMRLLDQAGHNLGAIATVFAYKTGDDKQALASKGTKIRDEIRKQIASKDKLFEAVN
jgi:hypothetical protein